MNNSRFKRLVTRTVYSSQPTHAQSLPQGLLGRVRQSSLRIVSLNKMIPDNEGLHDHEQQ